MALREEMEQQGNWLFKWRSYLPLLMIPVLFVALKDSGRLERAFGQDVESFWEFLSLCVAFSGMLVRCLVAGFVPRGTSGRNTQSQAASVLNTTGMYSVVRNPLYLGNFLISLGAAFFIQSWWFVLFVWLGFWSYYERIVFAEEEFLRKKFGEVFLKWAQNTPAFFPNFKNWHKADLSFSVKTVMRREFSTFFGITSSFTFLKIMDGVFTQRRFVLSIPWIIFYFSGLSFYLAMVYLKKKTKILDVAGR